LNSAARDAEIFDARFGRIAHEAILGHWSKLLADALERRHSAVPTAVNPVRYQWQRPQNQALVMLGEVMKALQKLQDHISVLEMKVASQSAEIASFREEQQKICFQIAPHEVP
jgi:hypothetical protein